MATIINCATDWTYDRFCEDAERYTAPEVAPKVWGYEREDFIQWFKFAANRFKAEWLKNHKGLYDFEWAGDAFAREVMSDGFFSDFYKDAYGQRPHLPRWFYVRVTGLPQGEDTVRAFCSDPVGQAIDNAKRCRFE